MKKIVISIVFALGTLAIGYSQNSKTDTLLKTKIKELSFMVGDWSGSGWMMGSKGKSQFSQSEKVQFKLDSTAVLVEGKGVSNGVVIHNALAILTYDKVKEHYVFRSYLPSGMSAEFKAEIKNNKLYWYPNENVRYIVWLNENGQWYETGEFKRGENWTQFFEMTLDKG